MDKTEERLLELLQHGKEIQITKGKDNNDEDEAYIVTLRKSDSEIDADDMVVQSWWHFSIEKCIEEMLEAMMNTVQKKKDAVTVHWLIEEAGDGFILGTYSTHEKAVAARDYLGKNYDGGAAGEAEKERMWPIREIPVDPHDRTLDEENR